MTARIRPVVVLFHPDPADIASLFELARREWRPLAVVNAATPAQIESLHSARIELIENGENIGLAQALNQGMERLFCSGTEYVVLLDQDTRPPPFMLIDLMARADSFIAEGGSLGCIGPMPVDRKAANLERRQGEAVLRRVPSVITSGQLIPRSAYDQVGGMWNELFIDNIDHEWCFRARARGLEILMASDVPMPHDLGDALVGPAGFQRILHRSPARHYHIVRNTLWLLACRHAPLPWRLWELARLAYRIPTYFLTSTGRARTLVAMLRGLRHGFAGPTGRSYVP